MEFIGEVITMTRLQQIWITLVPLLSFVCVMTAFTFIVMVIAGPPHSLSDTGGFVGFLVLLGSPYIAAIYVCVALPLIHQVSREKWDRSRAIRTALRKSVPIFLYGIPVYLIISGGFSFYLFFSLGSDSSPPAPDRLLIVAKLVAICSVCVVAAGAFLAAPAVYMSTLLSYAFLRLPAHSSPRTKSVQWVPVRAFGAVIFLFWMMASAFGWLTGLYSGAILVCLALLVIGSPYIVLIIVKVARPLALETVAEQLPRNVAVGRAVERSATSIVMASPIVSFGVGLLTTLVYGTANGWDQAITAGAIGMLIYLFGTILLGLPLAALTVWASAWLTHRQLAKA